MRSTRETSPPLGVLEAPRDAPVAPRCTAVAPGAVAHRRPEDPRAGFVLALVVFLLFAIGIASAAGYQVVLNEALLAVYANETQRALSIARAGLQRYITKQVGIHEDTVIYSIEGGDAVVTARLVAEIDDFETLYLLGSEGVYTDPTFTGSAARRTVYQYATKREVALDHLAALTQATGNVRLHNGTQTYGTDQASAGACEQPTVDIMGVMMGTGTLQIDAGGAINGSTDSLTVGSMSAVLDALALDWDLLTDTNFPVDYEDTWPSCSLPADSFPVTRFNGNVTGAAGVCGRGVLIVTGTLDVQENYSWEGVILAGYFDTPNNQFNVEGLVVSGLDGLGGYTDVRSNSSIRYDRCIAFKAGKRLSHFQPLGSTWWESM